MRRNVPPCRWLRSTWLWWPHALYMRTELDKRPPKFGGLFPIIATSAMIVHIQAQLGSCGFPRLSDSV